MAPLVGLSFLGASDCREIDSLGPLISLENLEVLYAFGTTRIVDNDLSPLLALPRLREVRLKDRREYKPRKFEIDAHLESK
jgi:internalin A